MEKNKGGTHYCCVNSCKNNGRKCKISFFTFPRNHERAQQWLINCGREDLREKSVDYLYRRYRICGAHFEKKMFVNPLNNRLLPSAVPTIFPTSDKDVDHNYSCLILPTSTSEGISLSLNDNVSSEATKSSEFIQLHKTPTTSRTFFDSCASSSASDSTQTDKQYRKSIKQLCIENLRLKKQVATLTHKLEDNLNNITIDQYMELTKKFCGFESLAKFINAQVAQKRPKGKRYSKLMV